MKKIILLFVIIVSNHVGLGQLISDTTENRFNSCTKNSFFLEVLGNGGFYSLNYDRIMFENKNLFITGRIGAFYTPARAKNFYLGCPLEVNILIGKKKHFFEFGLGLSYWFINDSYFLTDNAGNVIETVDERTHEIYLTGRIGYRYQNPKGGFFFRVGFTPLLPIFIRSNDKYNGLYSYRDSSPIPWGGISIGYTLKK